VFIGEMPMADLTRFVAFRVGDQAGKVEILFSMGLAIEGLPEGRDAAILRTTVDTTGKFLRYLGFLLATEDGSAAGNLRRMSWGENGDVGRGVAQSFLFEQMVGALCSARGQFAAIDGVVTKLAAQGGEADPIPPEFRELWTAFRAAASDEVLKHE
jgi:hypothetical protein